MGGRDSLRERPEGIRIDGLKAFRQGIREPVELVGGPVEYNYLPLLAGARDRAARAVLRIPTAGAADFFFT